MYYINFYQRQKECFMKKNLKLKSYFKILSIVGGTLILLGIINKNFYEDFQEERKLISEYSPEGKKLVQDICDCEKADFGGDNMRAKQSCYMIMKEYESFVKQIQSSKENKVK